MHVGRWKKWSRWGLLFILLVSLAGCGRGTSEEAGKAVTSLPDAETPENGEGRDVEEESGGSSGPKENGAGDGRENPSAGAEPKDETKDSSDHGEGTGDASATPSGASDSTVLRESNGPLAVIGTQLVDSQGNPVQLKGVSTHGLAWYPDYVNEECFSQLKEEWGIDVIRLAMYTGENGGYCTGGNQESLKKLVCDGVEYAADCGLYVIIDWHILSDGNPNTYLQESKAFFQEMSQKYADYTNVMYEICNEPNGGTAWSDVKSYAEQIIGVIRENDEDGIILVGTPNWCQYVDQAAADPIEDYENIMYTLHFYADTHRDSLRKAMTDAIAAGLPIFVSEYGICDASGNGAINREQADLWVDAMNQNGVSYVAWNLSNKGETSAILKSSCNKLSGFEAEDLSDSGKWLYEMLTGSEAKSGGPKTTDSNGVESGAGTAGASNTDSEGNASAKENNTAGNTVDSQQMLTDQSGLSVSASLVNSWEQDGQSCFQYVLTITNSTDKDCGSWSIQLSFDGEIALDNGWNGNYSADGSTLTISSVDYNGAIAQGGSVGDIGFIVRGGKGLALK